VLDTFSKAIPNVVITTSTCGKTSTRLALWRFPQQAPLHNLNVLMPKGCLSAVYRGRQFSGRYVSISSNTQLILQACVSSIDERFIADNAMHDTSQRSVIVDSQG
jgi:hypothetical protein